MAPEIRSSDLVLARRLEAAEAANALHLARATTAFESELIAGGCALYAGPGSPATHALGCGMSGPVSPAEVERLERFFFERGSDCLIDLCPMADTGLVAAVMERGYTLIEFNNVLVRPLSAADAALAVQGLDIESVTAATHREWLDVVARGFETPLELIENLPLYGETLLVRLPRDDRSVAVAAAGGSIVDGVALLFGDATLPEARGRGLQSALIRERLARAARAGCDLAMACVLPGSASHRNYERAGFRLAYMRVNVKRTRP
ncbi:MAG: GNAT family N-acetyltransferase [Bryobacteraceae bacterium]|jgi:GNAT superfamily N-acetyltransferase